jgi:hypothetical protein
MMKVIFDEVRIGDEIEFVYNGELRFGKVEKIDESKSGRWYATLKQDGYKSFHGDKMQDIRVLSEI